MSLPAKAESYAPVSSNMDGSEPSKQSTSNVDGLDYTRAEEKHMVKKLDLNVLFIISGMALFATMAQFDVGNAAFAGMSQQLGMDDWAWQLSLTLFFLVYSLAQLLVLCWVIFPVRLYASSVGLCVGVLASCVAAIHTGAAFIVVRCILALFLAGFLSGIPLYLTFFYYRREISVRMGVYQSISPLAFSISALIAMGISWEPHSMASWRIMLLVFGLPMILFSALGFVMLPNTPEDVLLLTPRERKIAISRTCRQIGHAKRPLKVDMRQTVLVITDIRALINAVMYFFINVSLSCFPVIPAIIQGIGFEEPPHAQGLTAAPFFLAFLLTLFCGWLSDFVRLRGPFVCGGALVGAIGYLLLAYSSSMGTRYFGLFMVCPGVIVAMSSLLTWVGNNQSSDSRRALAYWLLQFIGMTGMLLGPRLFRFPDGPYYRKGFWFSFGSLLLVAVLGAIEMILLYLANKRLDKEYGDVSRHECEASNEEVSPRTFRYYL